MLDPVLSLAISMQNGKGIYALLLGSGVSRSSGIPTGWEVIIDLIRKIAALKNEDCEPNPEAWYKEQWGNDPDYSNLLDELTKSSAERGLLLRSYFEPTEEDRAQGRKMPSPGHRAVAQLVKKGYVRVLITTNFDRLLEQALADLGVQPTVISTTDSTHGALPLAHSPCTIIKVHGDYLDSRIKNTRQELATYERAMDDLLDRVLDEYGLLICGWSAEWDIALRAALERCGSHRFGTYWAAHNGKVTGQATKIIAQRRATLLSIVDSDAFFRDLTDKIQALEDLSLVDPVSARVAVARMKRYLVDEQQRINLHDLVASESQRVSTAIRGENFSAADRNITPESVLHRLRLYESTVEVLLAMMACGGYWSASAQHSLICHTIKRIAEDERDASGMTVWVRLRRYPGSLLFYAAGIAAAASSNYGLLAQLFTLRFKPVSHQAEESILDGLSPLQVLDRTLNLLPGRDREFTPLNNHVFEVLRETLREYVPDEPAYDDAFDWFEYLRGLVYADITAEANEIEALRNNVPDALIRGPIGRFVWNRRSSGNSIIQQTRFDPDGPYPAIVTQALQGGLFGSSTNQLNYARFRLIKLGFDRLIDHARLRMGIWP